MAGVLDDHDMAVERTRSSENLLAQPKDRDHSRRKIQKAGAVRLEQEPFGRRQALLHHIDGNDVAVFRHFHQQAADHGESEGKANAEESAHPPFGVDFDGTGEPFDR